MLKQLGTPVEVESYGRLHWSSLSSFTVHWQNRTVDFFPARFFFNKMFYYCFDLFFFSGTTLQESMLKHKVDFQFRSLGFQIICKFYTQLYPMITYLKITFSFLIFCEKM